MASSIKVSELSSITNLTDGDLFLVSDVETNTSKKVSFITVANNLDIQDLSGYTEFDTSIRDLITAETTARQERVTEILTSISTEISNRAAAITELNENISASLENFFQEIEDRNFAAGLSTGYLYVNHVTVSPEV
jgi:hypothetical protein